MTVAPIVILIVAVAGLVLLAAVGFFVGYPPPRFPAKVLSAKEQAVLWACAESLFPARVHMPLTGGEAGVVEYLDAHLADLPWDKRLLIRLLVQFIEHGPWIFGPTRRFTSLDPAGRERFLAEMATSRFYFRRLCFVSLRTLLCMAYLAHPDIAARVGSTPNSRPFQLGGGQPA